MESFLFVFKVALERVLLLHESALLLGVPLSARVQFLDLAPLEAVQAAGAHADGGLKFDGFPERRTPPFYADAASMTRSLQRQPLAVTVFQQHPAAPLPVVVGAARAPVADQFCDLVVRARRCAARHPLAAVVRGEYPLLDVDGTPVGSVSLTARLVCFDGEALEQMREERSSRAESTAASVASRRSSAPSPCTDDRLVTTATNVCSKCMLPKRPSSTGGGHPHVRQQPSQAIILEETAESAAVRVGAAVRSARGRRPAREASTRAHVSRALPQQDPQSLTAPPQPTCLPPLPRPSDAPGDQLPAVAGQAPATGRHAGEEAGDTDARIAAAAAASEKGELEAPAQQAQTSTRRPAGPPPPCLAIPSSFSSATPRVSVPSARRASASSGVPPPLASPPPQSSAAGFVPSAGRASASSGVPPPLASPPLQSSAAGFVPSAGRASASSGVPPPLASPPLQSSAAGSVPSASGAPASGGPPPLGAPAQSATAPRPSAAGAAGVTVARAPASHKAADERPSAGVASGGRVDDKVDERAASLRATASTARAAPLRHDMFLWEAATHLGGPSGRSGAAAQPQYRPSGLWQGAVRASGSDWRAMERERIASHFLKMRDGLAWDPDLDTPLARYGHKQCVVPPRLVPGNQAWLWNTASASTNYQPRRGWYPGAIPRSLGLRSSRSQ